MISFLETRKVCYFYWRFIKVYSLWAKVSIGSGNGLASIRRQAITPNNYDQDSYLTLYGAIVWSMMFCAQWVDRYPVEGTQVSQVGQFAHHQQCGDFPGEGIEA